MSNPPTQPGIDPLDRWREAGAGDLGYRPSPTPSGQITVLVNGGRGERAG
ncbi:MAG TPA: hypothetical protein PLV68_10605 [Ilumatobacteraceae bacterium]|nr:hypothetical protein [Ilumatobacteraceae bacterium]